LGNSGIFGTSGFGTSGNLGLGKSGNVGLGSSGNVGLGNSGTSGLGSSAGEDSRRRRAATDVVLQLTNRQEASIIAKREQRDAMIEETSRESFDEG